MSLIKYEYYCLNKCYCVSTFNTEMKHYENLKIQLRTIYCMGMRPCLPLLHAKRYVVYKVKPKLNHKSAEGLKRSRRGLKSFNERETKK